MSRPGSQRITPRRGRSRGSARAIPSQKRRQRERANAHATLREELASRFSRQPIDIAHWLHDVLLMHLYSRVMNSSTLISVRATAVHAAASTMPAPSGRSASGTRTPAAVGATPNSRRCVSTRSATICRSVVSGRPREAQFKKALDSRGVASDVPVLEDTPGQGPGDLDEGDIVGESQRLERRV